MTSKADKPGRVVWSSGGEMACMRAEGRAWRALGPVVILLPWLRRRAALQAARTMLERAGVPVTVLALQDDLQSGPVALLNQAVQLLDSQVRFLVYAAEDAFAGRGWLRVALEQFQLQPEAGLLALNDGKWFGQLAAFGLVRRSWLNGLYGGLLFHPGYVRHYGDTELTVVALQQRSLAYHPHALLIEVDHGKDHRHVQPVDRQHYLERVRTGFGGWVTDAELLSRFR